MDFNALLTTGTEFDRAGRATRTFEDTDGLGAGAPATTSTTTYDAAGLVTTTKDRRQAAPGSTFGWTTNQYDTSRRLDVEDGLRRRRARPRPSTPATSASSRSTG